MYLHVIISLMLRFFPQKSSVQTTQNADRFIRVPRKRAGSSGLMTISSFATRMGQQENVPSCMWWIKVGQRVGTTATAVEPRHMRDNFY
jgi:hypothetical protein